MFFRPTTILLLREGECQIWQRRRQQAECLLTLSTSHPSFTADLAQALQRLRLRHTTLLLDMADFSLTREPVPNVSPLYQRKIRERRLAFIFPQQDLRAAFVAAGHNHFLAIPSTPAITAIFNILARLEVYLTACHLVPLEFLKQQKFSGKKIILYHAGTLIHLLATDNGQLLFARAIPASRFNNTDHVVEELKLSQAYLLRLGWQQTTPYELLSYNLPLPMLPPALPNISAQHGTPTNPAAMVLQDYFSPRRNWLNLRSNRMQKRQYHLRFIFSAARLAVIMGFILLSSGLFLGFNLLQTQQKVSQLQIITSTPQAANNLPITAATARNLQLTDLGIGSVLRQLTTTLPTTARLQHLTVEWPLDLQNNMQPVRLIIHTTPISQNTITALQTMLGALPNTTVSLQINDMGQGLLATRAAQQATEAVLQITTLPESAHE